MPGATLYVMEHNTNRFSMHGNVTYNVQVVQLQSNCRSITRKQEQQQLIWWRSNLLI
jgi:hypothetical protein